MQLLAGAPDGTATASIVIAAAVVVALAITVAMILVTRNRRQHSPHSMAESHRRNVEDDAGRRSSGVVIGVIVVISIVAILAFVLARAFDLVA